MLPEPDDEDESEDEFVLNFDIKRFRQNLKAGNFYDGKDCGVSLIKFNQRSLDDIANFILHAI